FIHASNMLHAGRPECALVPEQLAKPLALGPVVEPAPCNGRQYRPGTRTRVGVERCLSRRIERAALDDVAQPSLGKAKPFHRLHSTPTAEGHNHAARIRLQRWNCAVLKAVNRFGRGEHAMAPALSPVEAVVDPYEAAELAGLTHVSDDKPGIRRRRAGKGFGY